MKLLRGLWEGKEGKRPDRVYLRRGAKFFELCKRSGHIFEKRDAGRDYNGFLVKGREQGGKKAEYRNRQ